MLRAALRRALFAARAGRFVAVGARRATGPGRAMVGQRSGNGRAMAGRRAGDVFWQQIVPYTMSVEL
eukprot:8177922-Lingulodinium_polyedra.AAC.1